MEQVLSHGGSITLIHFVYQTNPERIACMPGMLEFGETPYHKNYQRTNDPRAVTCPACKKASTYETSRKAHEETARRIASVK